MNPYCPSEYDLHACIEGWLDPEAEQALRAHLAECPACQQKVSGWHTVSEALRSLPLLPAPQHTRISETNRHREWQFVLQIAVALTLISAWLWLAGFVQGDWHQAVRWTPYPTLVREGQKAAQRVHSIWQRLQEIRIWKG